MGAIKLGSAQFIAACFTLLIAACGRTDAIVSLMTPEGRDVVLLRQTRNPSRREFTTEINLGRVAWFSGPAGVAGELEVINGCLRIGRRHVVVWPKDFSLATEGDRIVVLDEASKPIVREGDMFRASGGSRSTVLGLSRFMPSAIASQVTELCEGPFWVILDDMERMNVNP